MRVLCIMVLLACSGCVVAKHPLVQALSPKNIARTVVDTSSLDAKARVHAKVPFLQPGEIRVESNGIRTVITFRPPVDPKEFARIQREAEAKHGRKNVSVVYADDKGVKR